MSKSTTHAATRQRALPWQENRSDKKRDKFILNGSSIVLDLQLRKPRYCELRKLEVLLVDF